MSDSSIQISWLNSPSVIDDSSLLLEDTSLSGSVSDALVDRILYKVVYLRNNGPSLVDAEVTDPTAYAAGFYVGSYGPNYEDNYNLHDVFQWASLTDGGGKRYGFFTVFGYDDNLGTNSYIDKFIADTLTDGELAMFQHNWLQGTGPSNRISLDVAYRYVNGTYQQKANFETYSDLSGVLPTGETNGLVKVLFGVRLPDSISATRCLFKHNLYYEEAV